MSVIDHAVSNVSTLLGISTTSASATLEAILDVKEQKRVAQVMRNWNLYNGLHYDYSRDDGEMPYYNLVYGYVEKAIAWLVGSPPILRGRKDIQALHEELVSEVIENSGNQLFYEAAQMGGVSGDVILQVGYDPDVSYGYGGVVIRVMDSGRTFFEYRNVGQRRILTRVMIIWDEQDQDGTVRTFAEVWDDKEVRVYPPGRMMHVRGVAALDDKILTSATSQTDSRGQEYTVYSNPYGELPFVHIPNMFISHNAHGRSDVHDLWVLNKEINEQMVSYKDNVDYHGNPITLLFGASAKNIEKGANKIWGNLPESARVENLEVTQTHEAILQYMKILKEAVGFSAFPSYLMALDDVVTSDTSAAAMRLAFLPLIELTDKKRITYGNGFKQAFEMAIRFMDDIYGLGLDSLNSPPSKLVSMLKKEKRLTQSSQEKIQAIRAKPYYYTEVQFQDHLPRNRTLELADLEVELRNRLESNSGGMRRIGVQDPQEKQEEILKDSEFLGEVERVFTDGAKTDAEVAQDDQAISEADAAIADLENPDDLTSGETTVPSSSGNSQTPPPETLPADAQAGNLGGRGRKKTPTNTNIVEDETGQSSDRTAAQRTLRGKGEI